MNIITVAILIATFSRAYSSQAKPGDAAKRILLQDNYYEIEERLNNLTTRLSAVENAVPRQAVAFKANLKKAVTPSANQLIVFDEIQFNLGQAYHRGVFVVPYSGVYLFSVSMCSAGGHYVAVDLMRNGHQIGYVLAGDNAYDSCNSETTITELQAGDDVSVQHHGTTGDYIHALVNSFTGALLSVK